MQEDSDSVAGISRFKSYVLNQRKRHEMTLSTHARSKIVPACLSVEQYLTRFYVI